MHFMVCIDGNYVLQGLKILKEKVFTLKKYGSEDMFPKIEKNKVFVFDRKLMLR